MKYIPITHTHHCNIALLSMSTVNEGTIAVTTDFDSLNYHEDLKVNVPGGQHIWITFGDKSLKTVQVSCVKEFNEFLICAFYGERPGYHCTQEVSFATGNWRADLEQTLSEVCKDMSWGKLSLDQFAEIRFRVNTANSALSGSNFPGIW